LIWTILALVMTVLMGGLIAYNGDLIGRKFGKRRLSLFGLRPKHTAILITSVTGVLISAITTGVLFLLVPPVREIILEGEQALAQNVRLSAQKATLERQKNEAQGALGNIKIRYDQARTEYQRVQTQLRTTSTQLQQTQSRLNQARSQLSGVRDDLAEARKALRATQDRNRRLLAQNKNLSTQNVDLASANVELANANDKLMQDQDVLKRKNDKLARYNVELTETNSKLAAQNESLVRENVTLTRQKENLTKQTEAMARTVNVLRGSSDALTEAAQRIVQELESRLQSLQESYGALRNRRVVIHGGEDLARTVVPANASPETVRQTIQSLMHEASLAALAKGAGPGSGTRAVQVVDRGYFAPAPSGGVVPIQITETDRIDAMVSRLAWSPTPVCLLALAVANSVENEPASIDFQPFTNRPVFKKGQRIFSRRVDATQSPERLFAELVDFLKNTGKSALEQGMIPHIDPATGEPQVGSLGASELVKLMERVRARERLVKITALAAADTNAADPLQLDFRVEPAL